MGGMVPLGDASRRPARVPVVTAGIIVVNVVVFALELVGGDAFVTNWSAIPAQIVSGHHWITIITAMFLHGSWSHIIGNMIFLWAFGPEIEDAMGPWRYSVFYLCGRDRGYACSSRSQSSFNRSQPGRQWGNCRGNGRVSGDLSSRSDSHNSRHLCVCEDQIHPGRTVDWLLVPHATFQCRFGGTGAVGRRGLPGTHRRLPLWGGNGASLRRATANRMATKHGLVSMASRAGPLRIVSTSKRVQPLLSLPGCFLSY